MNLTAGKWSLQARTRYLFRDYVLVVEGARRTLLRGATPVPVQDAALEVLVVLAEARGEPVLRARFNLEDMALSQRVRRLRRATSEDLVVTAKAAGGGTLQLAAVVEIVHDRGTPERADSFVGRLEELAGLASTVRSGARVLTLHGCGGSGKTRLARRFMADSTGTLALATVFVDLSEARSTPGILLATARALALEVRGEPVRDIGHAIAGRGRVLVVFDNLEQVVNDAAGTIGRWIDSAPEAIFVLTSRVRTGLRGEQLVAVDGMTPGDAADLFHERAVTPLLPDADVTALVRELDYLPLAIELAAARTRVLPVAKIRQELSSRFHLLARARGGSLPRHDTLRACLDWSWDLLSETEREHLTQLSVFEGGFTSDAAGAVLDTEYVIDALDALAQHALLRVSADRHRISLHLSIQEYAAERLRGAARERAERNHMRWFADLGGTEVASALCTREGLRRVDELCLDADNLVVAARRASRRGDAGSAVGAALGLSIVLQRHVGGIGVEEVTEVRRAFPAEPRAVELLREEGRLLATIGNLAGAQTCIETALAEARTRGMRRLEGILLGDLGVVHQQRGEVALARDLYQQALSINVEVRNRVFEGIVRGNLGVVSDAPHARQLLGEALEIHRSLGNLRSYAAVLGDLGWLLLRAGLPAEAATNFERALDIHRELHDRRFEGIALSNLGAVALEQGRNDEAFARFQAALAIHREVGNRRSEGIDLGNLGLLEANRGRLASAEAFYTAALEAHRAVGNLKGEAMVVGNRALVNEDLDRPDDARRDYESALALHRRTGDRQYEGEVLTNLAAFCVHTGNVEEALPNLTTALAIHRELKNLRFIGVTLIAIAESHLASSQVADARKALEEAEPLFRDARDRVNLFEMLVLRSEIDVKHGAIDRAWAAVSEAEELAAAMGVEPGSKLCERLSRTKARLMERR